MPAPRIEIFPRYLLEELAPQRSSKSRSIALILSLAVIAATAWAFYTRSKTGSFPPLVRTLDAAVTRIWARRPFKPAKPDQSVAQQPASTASDQSDLSSSDSNSSGPATNSHPQPSAASDSAEATQTTAPGIATGVQPSSASDQPATPPSSSPIQQNENNDVSVEAVGQANSQPAGGTTAEVSDASNAKPSPAIKPVKNLTPGAAPNVDGFTAKDVPELVRQADAAEERGDYRLARYQYLLILKLDRKNNAARAGLYRVNATGPSH